RLHRSAHRGRAGGDGKLLTANDGEEPGHRRAGAGDRAAQGLRGPRLRSVLDLDRQRYQPRPQEAVVGALRRARYAGLRLSDCRTKIVASRISSIDVVTTGFADLRDFVPQSPVSANGLQPRSIPELGDGAGPDIA